MNTCIGELFAEFRKVFNNSVVNDGYFAVSRDMRVSVAIGGTAVSCPPGMSDSRR